MTQYKYAFVWGKRTHFIYAESMHEAKAKFQKEVGFNPKLDKVHITRYPA